MRRIALSAYAWAGILIDQDRRDLLEVQEPVGQLQVARVEQLGACAKPAFVLVVRIQHDHVTIRMRIQNRPQDHGHRTGLAGAGCAEHGKVLAQQVVGDRERRQVGGVLERAETHRRGLRPRIDGTQLLTIGGMDRAVERGMAGHAALEAPAVGPVFRISPSNRISIIRRSSSPPRRPSFLSVVITPKVRAGVPCRRTTAPISTVLATSASITPQTRGPATEITRPMRAPGVASGRASKPALTPVLGLTAGAAAWAP